MAESKTAEELQGQVATLKEWVASQPHMPKDMNDRLLRRFLHSCYYDIEKAQKAMESFTSLRATSPDLFNNRDPRSTPIQNVLKITNLAHLPISDNRNLWIWQLNDPGLENFDYVQDARLFFLTSDAAFLDDDNDSLPESDIVIMDVKDISLKIITKFNMSVAKKAGKYQEEAMPIRLKQIHIVNTPPFIDKIYSLIKQFMHKDLTEMVHFHSPNSDTLYKFLSKDDLPKDYGGNLPGMNEQMEKVLEVLYRQREALLNNDLWKAPEKKSKKKSKNSASPPSPTCCEEVTSFRSLAID